MNAVQGVPKNVGFDNCLRRLIVMLKCVLMISAPNLMYKLWKYILPKVVQLYVISCIMTKLLGSVHCGRDDIMTSAVKHGRVPPHQSNRDSTEKLARWFSLVTALLSGQSLPKSPHHIRCHTMKAPESFYCQRRKLEPLSSARFCSLSLSGHKLWRVSCLLPLLRLPRRLGREGWLL